MRARSGLCFVLAWISCAVAYKQCSDCKTVESCEAAVNLLRKAEPASNAKLRAATCGYEANNAKVCCAELVSVESLESRSGKSSTDSVEGHSNLRLLPESCGDINGDKIIGGRTAKLYEYPWMVLLSYKRRGELMFDCAGTLINERYVLTAAHCVDNQPIQGVRIGDLDYETASDCEGYPPLSHCEDYFQDMRIEKMVTHSNYTRGLHDIALLRLKKKVDFNLRNVGAVCLPVTRELQDRHVIGLNATVTGWGLTEANEKSSKLLTVDVLISNYDSCLVNLFNRHGPGEEAYNICAGQEGRDSCNGDSGGPLMLRGYYKDATRFVEYGIVSKGPNRCGSGRPASYTNVAKHMKWILDNIEP